MSPKHRGPNSTAITKSTETNTAADWEMNPPLAVINLNLTVSLSSLSRCLSPAAWLFSLSCFLNSASFHPPVPPHSAYSVGLWLRQLSWQWRRKQKKCNSINGQRWEKHRRGEKWWQLIHARNINVWNQSELLKGVSSCFFFWFLVFGFHRTMYIPHIHVKK